MKKRHPIPTFATVDSAIQALLEKLKAESYSESHIYKYELFLYHLRWYMVSHGIEDYVPEVGRAFIDDYFSTHTWKTVYKRELTVIIRRMNDVVLGETFNYRAQQSNIHKAIPTQFRAVLNNYLCHCADIANKQTTLNRKLQYCELFFYYVATLGCYDIGQLTPDLVIKSCLLFNCKGGWPFVGILLRYLLEVGEIKYDLASSVPHIRRPNPLPTVYSEEEVRQIERSVDKNSKVGIRDYAILLLASRCGIRCGDIALLKFENIDIAHNTIQLVQQKTEQPLMLPLLLDVKTALLDYINRIRPINDSAYIFLRLFAPYKPMTSSAISLVTKRAFEKSGINIKGKKHGSHSLRSSLATSMVNDDVPYEVVRKVLGHANPDTIQHYAKVHIEKLREYALPVPSPNGSFAGMLAEGAC